MPFDVVSFIVGVAAGAITGALAGLLHALESTADLQERLRQVTKEVQGVNDALRSFRGPHHGPSDIRLTELQRDLDEIHEEIRRMYKRTSR